MENKTTYTFSQAIQSLLNAGNDIVRSEDESHYIHKPTGQKLLRCTQFIEGLKPFGMTPESPWYGCLAMGTAADQMVRDYFVEGIEYVNKQSQLGVYDALTPAAQIQLASAVRAYDASVVRPQGWKVLADRVYLYSLELGVAGEVDLILYNNTTKEIKIIDMKTVRSPQYIGQKTPKYQRQLNTYRVMAEELMGGHKVTDLEIMWIRTSYEKFDKQSTTAYMHDMMPVDIKDVFEDIGNIWLQEAGYHFKDHTFGRPKEEEVQGTTNLLKAFL